MSNQINTNMTFNKTNDLIEKENSNAELNVDDNLEPEEFYHQDDTQIDIEIEGENLKFTKIDCLDEDPQISDQRYLCISFISPEGLMNCKTRGFKLRGVFSSLNDAKQACKKFQKQDPYFDVYVGEVGKWCPWDPTPQQVKDVVYKGKDQNEIMKSVQEKELQNLNEIVGRQKEKLDGAKVSHKKRIAKSMKENLNALKDNKQHQEDFEKEKNEKDDKIERARNNGRKPLKSSEKGKEAVRERLRKHTENNEKQKEANVMDNLDEQRRKLNDESQRIKEKEDTSTKIKQRSVEVDEKLAKMKEYLNQKRQQKKENVETV